MRPSSISRQLTGFTLAVVAAAMALSFAIALSLPPPAPGRMSIDEMEWALRSKPSKVIDADRRDQPPGGVRSRLVEAALAKALGVQAADVRAVWVNTPEGSTGRGQTVIMIDQRDVLIDATGSGFQLRYGPGASLKSSTLVPLFIAAVRKADGEWLWGVPKDPAREAWLRRIVGAFAVGLFAVWPLATLLSRQIAKPVERLGLAAATTKASDLEPFPADGPAEVRTMAQAMNAMHRRIQLQAHERIRMLAGLAHDLRTPLTALRLRTEGMPAPLKDKMSHDLARISNMADEMLDRATIGAYSPKLVTVDLTALLRTCCDVQAEVGDVVASQTWDQVTVETDPMLARRLIDNLLDNALRYGARASVSLVNEGASAVITIDDNGPGIPEDRIMEALKPFSRLQPTLGRTGTGLGLAIASEISEAIGARIELTNQSPGLSARAIFMARAERD